MDIVYKPVQHTLYMIVGSTPWKVYEYHSFNYCTVASPVTVATVYYVVDTLNYVPVQAAQQRWKENK